METWTSISVVAHQKLILREGRIVSTLMMDKEFLQRNRPAIGLNDSGYSTQAYFLDYDKDGDIDCYVLNHLTKVKSDQLVHWKKEKLDLTKSDRLYRNDGNRFTDVTLESGILNQCWGLSVSIDDFNNDGWPDLYVCNDFREGDLLYLNNHKGGFTEALDEHFLHTSFYSMGSDVADLNND